MACSTLVEDVSENGETITLQPLQTFPLVRDLVVDRGAMVEALGRVRSRRPLDDAELASTLDTSDANAKSELGRPAPGLVDPKRANDASAYAGCIGCGACLDACPSYGPRSAFVGAAAINEVARSVLSLAPSSERRLQVRSLTVRGGVADCGKAMNCVEVCPKKLPLVDAISDMAKETTRAIFRLGR
jgi:succinate dehydrogenase / fumarate reductase iron-sulfur subunit